MEVAMKVFSTFSGIGGFELGIKRAFKAKHLPPPGFVGYSETDRFAVSVYEHNFKGVKNYGDIRKIKERELPDFDCLVGGFPCQAFSLAGVRRGFNDERGALFFDVVRILRAKRPGLFVLENVKGLLSHDYGRTFKTIVVALAELGYDIEWQVLDSKNFGVPQHRERVIIVGYTGTPGGAKVFPVCPHGKKTVRAEYGRREPGSQDRSNRMSLKIPEGTKRGYAEARIGDSVNLSYLGSKTKRGRVGKGIAHTLTASCMAQYTPCPNEAGRLMLRRFTPMECERLQGFPDGWTEYGTGGRAISDTQRYKMCGNAVTVNVIQAVFERLVENGIAR
jgi:DNA (cytosine-5)-methyltransferase 1